MALIIGPPVLVRQESPSVNCGIHLVCLTALDALHVATAGAARQDMLVSWNFRHLVNQRRRDLVNEVNRLAGYPPSEILAPPEV